MVNYGLIGFAGLNSGFRDEKSCWLRKLRNGFSVMKLRSGIFYAIDPSELLHPDDNLKAKNLRRQ